MEAINKIKEMLGQEEIQEELKGEVSVTYFAKGEDKYNIASKNAVNSLKEKLRNYCIEELAIEVLSSEKISDKIVEEITNNIKKQFEYDITVILKNKLISHDMENQVYLTLYTDIISLFDSETVTISKIRQSDEYIKNEYKDETKLLKGVEEIVKKINLSEEKYKICNFYLKCDISKVSISLVQEIFDIFMRENKQLTVSYNMGISNNEGFTLFIGLDK